MPRHVGVNSADMTDARQKKLRAGRKLRQVCMSDIDSPGSLRVLDDSG